MPFTALLKGCASLKVENCKKHRILVILLVTYYRYICIKKDRKNSFVVMYYTRFLLGLHVYSRAIHCASDIYVDMPESSREQMYY